MSYVGIDFDTKAVHLVKIDDEFNIGDYTQCELAGDDAFDRTRSVRGAMPHSSYWDDVVAVAVEEPAGRLTGRLFRVQGAVLACIPRAKLVTTLMPSQWRKAVGLKGNASKDDVFRLIGEDWIRYSNVRVPQDAFDAYCMAIAVRQLVELAA